MAIREGRWDCPQCGTQGILGRRKVCPNCGSPRPEGVEFYLPEEAEELKDEGLQKQARVGPDWICEYCGASNSAASDECKQCFAPRSGDRVQKVKLVSEKVAARSARPQAVTAAPTGVAGIPRGLLIAAGVLLLCFVASYLLFFRTSEITGTVTGQTWERVVVVEALQSVVEEDWTVPNGARILSEEEALYETRQVQVGERTYVCDQRDLGNGFFEDVMCTEPIYREEPVYRTRYEYEVDRWVEVRTEDARGTDTSAFWPQVNLSSNERQGETREVYRLYVAASDGQNYTITVPFEVWRRLSEGDEAVLEINALGGASLGRAPP